MKQTWWYVVFHVCLLVALRKDMSEIKGWGIWQIAHIYGACKVNDVGPSTKRRRRRRNQRKEEGINIELLTDSTDFGSICIFI